MALEADFLAMSTQTVNVYALSTMDACGAPSYSTSPSTFSIYREPGTRVVVNAQGVEEVASEVLYVLSSSATIGPQAKLSLSDGRTPKIIRVDILNDEEGQHHLEVYV